MRLLLVSLLGVLLLWAGLHASARQAAPAAQAPPVDFTRDVLPILESRCFECHGPKKSRGRLRLDRKAAALKGGMTGPAVVPHDGERSLLVRRLLGLDGEDRMPLDEDPLPEEQIALLRAWIDGGAPWPDDGPAVAGAPGDAGHWAYRAPVRPAVPRVSNAEWARTPIDAFVLARLESEGLAPAPEAGRRALLRRVSLDLVGLPPTPAEIDAFLADTGPGAYERVVDRLLASPHYGERWARPWLDLARYADSHGYEKDGLRTMWKYRDWVIAALNDDMPFDQFTVEQIAGDMLPGATVGQQIASGFHRNTLLNQEGGIDVEEARWDTLVDRVNTTSTVWLGSTIACAQCHNHKYDPFSQKDYYRLLAFFDNVEYTVGGATGQDRWVAEPTLDLPTPDQEKARAALKAELAGLEARVSGPAPDLDAAQPAWEAEMRALAGEWIPLAPDKATARAATLRVADDHSVLASGAHPGSDRYTIDAALPAGRPTGLRLEALPDPSLPQGGPGRDYYGNFVLTGIAAELRPPSGPAVALTFEAVTADDSSGGDPMNLIRPPARPYAREVPAGWSIDATRDTERLARQAVFRVGAVDAPAGSRLAVTLAFDTGNVGQALGRFRLSVSGTDTPEAVASVRARTRPALALPAAARSESQARAVRAEFRARTPLLAATRQRIAAIEQALDELGVATALVMRERPSFERPSTPLRERGVFMMPGERVYAATPDVLPPMPHDQMPNRLGLARWLVSPGNPLTARVAVNRAWEQIFGRGLVETSEDFGTQGAAPSHPELLDWLATEFVKTGWRQKALHRLIVTSSTYRQDAAASRALIEKDPHNRLLARGPRFRMDAEMLRDVALAASGLLSPRIGGPSVFPVQPDGIWDNPYSDATWTTSPGPDRYRRGLYTFIRRTSPYPSFMTFDASSREVCTVRRMRTNTPLQALTMLNDEAFFEAARAMGSRLAEACGTAGGTSAARSAAVDAFVRVAGRVPTEPEIDRIAASYERQLRHFRERPQAAAAVMKVSPGSPALAEQAAWTMVANALLNLDEVVTK